MAFVVPTREMGVWKGREVEPGGRVREEIVEEWWRSWQVSSNGVIPGDKADSDAGEGHRGGIETADDGILDDTPGVCATSGRGSEPSAASWTSRFPIIQWAWVESRGTSARRCTAGELYADMLLNQS